MGDSENALEKVIVLAIAIVVGVICFSTFCIPMVIDSVGELVGDYNRYNTILYLLPMVGIFGMMVVVVRYFTSGSKR